MKQIKKALLLLFSLFYYWLPAQSPPEEDLEILKRYQWPLISTRLTGTFGELRHRHLHYGLDIGTFFQEGFPVHAIADGEIVRIFVDFYGYGKALYIQHANGLMSVYAHLDRFAPWIEAYIRPIQRKQQDFHLNHFPHRGFLKVKKGDIIGYSGNTGASSGPHLHFEIRTPTEKIMHPFYLFRDEVSDRISPVLRAIAFEPLSDQSYINGEIRRASFSPLRSGSFYHLTDTIYLEGPFGLEFSAYDRIDGSSADLDVYAATLYLDSVAIFHFQMDSFHFWQSPYVMEHYNYAMYSAYGSYYHKMYQNHRNKLPIYTMGATKGVLNIQDSSAHKLKLVIEDFHGNIATFECIVKRGKLRGLHPCNGDRSGKSQKVPHYLLVRNGIFRYVLGRCLLHKGEHAYVRYSSGKMEKVSFERLGEKHIQLVLPLHYPVYPESIILADSVVELGALGYGFPGVEQTFHIDSRHRLYLPKRSLTDTTLLFFRWVDKETFYLGPEGVPIITPIYFCVKAENPAKVTIGEVEKDGTIDYVDNTRRKRDEVCAPIKTFGYYQVREDYTPPRIYYLGKKETRAGHQYYLFSVVDDLSEIAPRFVKAWDRETGEWIYTEFYDYQKLIRIPVDWVPSSTRWILIEAFDHCGNKGVYHFRVPGGGGD